MKKYIQLLLIAGLTVCVTSCQRQNTDTSIEEASVVEQSTDTISSDSSEVKEMKLSQELLVRIDLLTASCDSLRTDINKTDKEVKKMKSITYSWNLATVFSVIAAVIACIICIYLLVRLSENEEKTKNLKNEKDGLEGKIVDLKSKLVQLEQNQQCLQQIINAVNLHEDRINRLTAQGASKKTNKVITVTASPSGPRFEPQIRYAEQNNEGFFLELLSSRSETCIYELTLTSDTEAEYTIVSINKIKSFNGWESAITCQGDVRSARDFRLVHKGKCQLTQDQVWKITKKLEINAI